MIDNARQDDEDIGLRLVSRWLRRTGEFFFSVEIGSRYKNDYLMEEMRNDRKFKSIAFNPFQLLKNDTAMVS